MKARLIVTTIVLGGVALAVGGAMALAGKPAHTAPLSRSQDRRPAHLNLVNQQQNEYPALLERHREHRSGPLGGAPGPTSRGGDDGDRRGTGVPGLECSVQVRRAAEAGNGLLQRRRRAGRRRLRVPPGPPPLAHRRHRAVRGPQGKPDGLRSSVATRSRRRSASSTGTGSTATRPRRERTFFDCYASSRASRPAGSTSTTRRPTGQQVDPHGAFRTGTTTTSSRPRTPTGTFLETNYTNNTAWVKFTLTSESNGNRKVTVIGHSPCESPGMCGENAPNR